MTTWGITDLKVSVSLCTLSFGAVVYHIWKQRDDLQQGNVANSEEQILKRIDWEIRTRVMGAGTIKKSIINKSLCCRWGFKIEHCVNKLWFCVCKMSVGLLSDVGRVQSVSLKVSVGFDCNWQLVVGSWLSGFGVQQLFFCFPVGWGVEIELTCRFMQLRSSLFWRVRCIQFVI